MKKRFTWKKIESRCIHNLHVLEVDGIEFGLIWRNKGTRYEQSAWVIHTGIGETSKFLGHAWDKTDAKKMLENLTK